MHRIRASTVTPQGAQSLEALAFNDTDAPGSARGRVEPLSLASVSPWAGVQGHPRALGPARCGGGGGVPLTIPIPAPASPAAASKCRAARRGWASSEWTPAGHVSREGAHDAGSGWDHFIGDEVRATRRADRRRAGHRPPSRRRKGRATLQEERGRCSGAPQGPPALGPQGRPALGLLHVLGGGLPRR
jgi:hypothetical protein